MEPGQPEASLGQADAVLPCPVAGQSLVFCMPGHASAVCAGLIVCRPAGPVSGRDVSVGSFPRPTCPLKMGARFKSRGFGSKKTGDFCFRRRIPTALRLRTGVPSDVPISGRDQRFPGARGSRGTARPKKPSRKSTSHLLVAGVSVRPVHGVLPERRRRRPGGFDRGRDAAATSAVVLGGRGHTPDAGPKSATGRCVENLVSRPVTDPSMAHGDSEPGGAALFLAGTAMSPAGAGGSGSRFVQSMGEDRLGLRPPSVPPTTP